LPGTILVKVFNSAVDDNRQRLSRAYLPKERVQILTKFRNRIAETT